MTTLGGAGGFFAHAASARDRYVAFLQKAIVDLRANASAAVEVLVKPRGRTTPEPFCLCRVDALTGTAAAPRIERIADRLPAPEPLRDRLESGLDLTQESFSWECLRLLLEAKRFDIAMLGPWLRKWLDPDEERSARAEWLSGVVHDLSWDSVSDAWVLTVDLGSAPLDALRELMNVIADAGAVAVTVSSGDAADDDAASAGPLT